MKPVLGILKRLLMFVGLSQAKRFAKNCASNIYPPKADHGNPRDSEAVPFVVFNHYAAFLRLIRKSLDLTLKMLGDLSHKHRILTTQIENLSTKEIPARLAAYLLFEAQEQGQGPSVDLKIAKSQLASMLSTIPETLSRVFAKLSAHCFIRVEGRKVVLLDPVGLTELSETGKILS
jgi:CRP/FNR family transcriptional regulator